jgi:hypothetical protein
MYNAPVRRYLQGGVTLFLVAASVLGVYNVISDNAEVERLAESTACKGEKNEATCRVQKTRMERTPFAQTFDYATPSKKQVTVRCARALVFVGEYACEQR